MHTAVPTSHGARQSWGVALVVAAVTLALLPSAAQAAPPTSLTQVGGDIEGPSQGAASGSSLDISADGRRVIIGSPLDDDATGLAQVFEQTADGWKNIGELKGDGIGDQFGSDVAMSDDGNVIAVGSRYADVAPESGGTHGNNTGLTRVYRLTGDGWLQIGGDMVGIDASDQFGASVDLSADGERVVVGAPYHDDRGQARVFAMVAGSWTEILHTDGHELHGESEDDLAGSAVAINAAGDTIVVGARDNDGANGWTNSGHARVFTVDADGKWRQVGQDLDGESAGDLFGFSVDISANGDHVVVGGPQNDGGGSDAGHARAFALIGGAWDQLGEDIDGPHSGARAGSSVAMSADGLSVIIGAPKSDMAVEDMVFAEIGSAQRHHHDGSGWQPVGPPIHGTGSFDFAGTAVEMSPDGMFIMIGSPGHDNSAGHSRVFGPSSTQPGPVTVSAGGPYSTTTGTSLTMTATGTDPDGGTLTYTWDLDNDGTYETTGNPVTKTWTTAGTYTIHVKATNAAGSTATDTTTVTVTDAPAVTVSAGGPYTATTGTSLTMTATGTDPDGGTLTYTWDLDNDGTYETTGNPVTKTWTTAGTYTINVKAINAAGSTATDTTTVTVTDATTTPPGTGGPTPGGPTPGGPTPGGPTPPGGEIDTAQDDGLDANGPIPFAVAVSQLRFPDDGSTPQYVVLARVDVFADALGGSVLTGDGPMLYTQVDRLDTRTALEIDRLLDGSGTVYMLGGEAALSPAVEQALLDAGYTVRRLEGPTRVETALAVADEALRLPGINPDGIGLARSDDWADAITGGGWAAGTESPILITPTNSLHPAVAEWLRDNSDLSVTILGGEAAISRVTAQEVGQAVRVAGVNRYATAVQIADQLWTEPFGGFVISNGSASDGWAYTLAVAAHAAELNWPMLLVDSNRLPAETNDRRCEDADAELLIVGPESLISDSVRDELAAGC